MKEITLSKGEVAIVDDEDFERINRYRWYKSKGGYANGRGKRQEFIIMHRLILNVNMPNIKVDHIDHDTLNNTKTNLRLSTSKQNSRNKTSAKGSTSDYLGVYWHKQIKRWVSKIRVNGKNKHIGSFKNSKEAALSYDAKAIQYFGHFANPNFNCPVWKLSQIIG